MSDAPTMTQEQVDDAEDRFIKQVLFEAGRTAIRQQKSNERQPRNPGQYNVSEAAEKCIEGYKVDMIYTQEVKERFSLNDLDRANLRP